MPSLPSLGTATWSELEPWTRDVRWTGRRGVVAVREDILSGTLTGTSTGTSPETLTEILTGTLTETAILIDVSGKACWVQVAGWASHCLPS